jgi:hypothetical protein
VRITRTVLATVLALWAAGASLPAQVRLADESDRAAFRNWFVLLADTQFERQTPDVIDCAALVRHAFREALRAHTPEWVRTAQLPFAPQFADVHSAPRPSRDGFKFRLSVTRVALASLWFVVLIALPWGYLVPWRPAWLPPTAAELAFSVVRLSIAATLVAAGTALIIREGSPRTPAV